MQISRRSYEPRKLEPAEEHKSEKEDTRMLKELWNDFHWDQALPEQTDVYIPKKTMTVQTRSGRIVRPKRSEDMLYY